MDKSRQLFERKFYNKFNFELTNKGNYRYFSTNIAWESWKASRESLEIELPKTHTLPMDEAEDAYREAINDCKEILISNGVKIKNE